MPDDDDKDPKEIPVKQQSIVNIDGPIRFVTSYHGLALVLHQTSMTLDEAIAAGYFNDED